MGVITPSDMHFERHHAGIPQIDPKRYKLLIHGMVERPMAIDAAPTLHIDLRPVGVVHSPVADLIEMPPEGLPATIEVFPEYAPGLFRLESNTHITVVGRLDRARRDTPETVRPNGRGDPRRRGSSPAAARPAPTPSASPAPGSSG